MKTTEIIKPIVSVVVPIYNSERTLVRCIESVLHQSLSDIQLILVDDGSSDSSKNICRRYAAENDNILFIENNHGGISKARNMGIEAASGEFIAFLDSDDFLDSSMLEVMGREAESYSSDVVITSFKRISGSESRTNEKLDDIKSNRFERNDFKKLLSHFFSPSGSSCYITTFLIRGEKCPLFDEEISFMEDAEFISRLLARIDSVYISDSYLYNHLENETGVSVDPERMMENITGILRAKNCICKTFASSGWSQLTGQFLQMTCHAIVNRLLSLKKLEFRKIRSEVRNCFMNDELINLFRQVDLNGFSDRMRLISFLIGKRSVIPVSLLIKAKGLL